MPPYSSGLGHQNVLMCWSLVNFFDVFGYFCGVSWLLFPEEDKRSLGIMMLLTTETRVAHVTDTTIIRNWVKLEALGELLGVPRFGDVFASIVSFCRCRYL